MAASALTSNKLLCSCSGARSEVKAAAHWESIKGKITTEPSTQRQTDAAWVAALLLTGRVSSLLVFQERRNVGDVLPFLNEILLHPRSTRDLLC